MKAKVETITTLELDRLRQGNQVVSDIVKPNIYILHEYDEDGLTKTYLHFVATSKKEAINYADNWLDDKYHKVELLQYENNKLVWGNNPDSF